MVNRLQLGARALSALKSLWGPLSVLGFAVLFADNVSVIHDLLDWNDGSLMPLQQVSGIAVWLAAALLVNRLLGIVFWDGFVRHALGRKPPRLIIQLTGVLVFLIAVTGIVRFVFGESVTAIWATSGAIGLVIGLALRNLILDTFSGLAIHMERPFRVGDWINCHTRMGSFIGRVEETNWRTTRLWTTSRNLIIIPNSFLTTTVLTNFSLPETAARFEMDFVLDFSVPTDRALRILNAALADSVGKDGPVADPRPKVRANGITEHGVQYRARYYLEPADTSPSRARHTISLSVMQHLSQAGLTLSYPRRDVFLARMPWRQKDWAYLKDQIRHLRRLSLFEGLDTEDLELLAKNMEVRTLNRGTVVVRQGEGGSSMFVLAEGLLEVLIDQPTAPSVKVAVLAPGTFFGEKSLLTGDPRSATVVCMVDSTICEITKDCMAELLERKPALAETLARAVIGRDMQNEIALSKSTQAEVDSKVSSVVGQFLKRMTRFFA